LILSPEGDNLAVKNKFLILFRRTQIAVLKAYKIQVNCVVLLQVFYA